MKDWEELSKLIIGLSYKYNIINNEKEQIDFSKKYQVLSEYTTLFADIENDVQLQMNLNLLKQTSTQIMF